MPHIDSPGIDSVERNFLNRWHPQARPLSVLIVDDEERVRTFIERTLNRAGLRTAVASDGAEALAVASTLDCVDVLVTDLMMPDMTGEELALRLRVNVPTLKVLYLTGYADQLFSERIPVWQEEVFVDKPCSINGLLEALAVLVSGQIDHQSPWATT